MLQSFTLLRCAVVKAKLSDCVCVCGGGGGGGGLRVYSTVLLVHIINSKFFPTCA